MNYTVCRDIDGDYFLYCNRSIKNVGGSCFHSTLQSIIQNLKNWQDDGLGLITPTSILQLNIVLIFSSLEELHNAQESHPELLV